MEEPSSDSEAVPDIVPEADEEEDVRLREVVLADEEVSVVAEEDEGVRGLRDGRSLLLLLRLLCLTSTLLRLSVLELSLRER